LLSTKSQNASNNSTDEIQVGGNDKVSFVSAPKNVKFLIPLGRAGITSNESTYGVIESTTRTITHVKDIFAYDPSLQSHMITNNETDTISPSSSSNSAITASVFDTEQGQNITKINSEEIPLLPNNNSSDN
jgi:hypothetical protein